MSKIKIVNNKTVLYCIDFNPDIKEKAIAIVPCSFNGRDEETRIVHLNGNKMDVYAVSNLPYMNHTRHNAFYSLEDALKYCNTEDNVLKVTMKSDEEYERVVESKDS